MTRLTNPERVEKEARLQEAIAAVERGEKTPYRAVIDFNVQKQTLYNRLNGKLPRNKAHEQEQILTNAEEKELVRWITRLTFTGYPPRPVYLTRNGRRNQKPTRPRIHPHHHAKQ